jgi:hypothetical protein
VRPIFLVALELDFPFVTHSFAAELLSIIDVIEIFDNQPE